MPFIILISALAACWVYRDAQKYGYGKSVALLWAVGTIAVFLVTFPVYLLFGRKFRMGNKKIEHERIEQTTIEAEAEDMQRCPMCDKSVGADAKHCPHCGYTLQLVCKNCGEPLERYWPCCPNCKEASPEK